MKDLIKKLNADDYATLGDDIEDLAAKKIAERIKSAKAEVIEKLNKKKVIPATTEE